MPIEHMIEIASIILALGLVWFFVPFSKMREGMFSFLFMQSLTWILGGIVVEMRLISYPVRFFSYAFRTSFSFEYIVFPVISVIFNLYFPKNRGNFRKLLYSFFFPTLIIIGEVILEKNTETIKYLNWNWFYSWISMWGSLFIAYACYVWFFKKYTTIKPKRGNLNFHKVKHP